MHEKIVEHIEEIEDEWERPIGERLMKIAVLAAVGFGFTLFAEWAYDKVRDRREASDEDEAQPSLEK
jgi:hypothetical protein